MPKVHVFNLVFDLRSVNTFFKIMQSDSKPRATGPIRAGMNKAALIYVEWLRKRYRKYTTFG